MENGKVLVKTMHVFYEHSTLHQPVCRRPPPPPPPQIKNRFLLEKASVLATLHEPAELRRLRSIGHGLFIQPMRTTKCGVIFCRRILLRSMKWQERPEGDLHLSLRSLAIVGFLGSLNSLSIFSPMLPSRNRPKFKCPPITVNQSQLLFITNFNGEIMSRFNFLFVLCESCVMVANLDLFNLPCLVQADPTLSSVALIIRTKVTYISRLQVSGCLHLSPFPLSVCLSVRRFIVKKSCDNFSTGYETFLRYLFVLRLRSINYRVVIMPNPEK